MPRFQALQAWQKAHELALEVYRLSQKLPPEERYGLRGQMRRAAVSAAANIAEGRERGSDADFGRFLSIAAGSVAELQYYLILARDLGYLDDLEIQGVLALAAETMRVIRALQGSLGKP